jgi:hypothetical protein
MAVPYDFREPQGWAEKVAQFDQRRLDDGAVVILYGDCPRCGDLMDVELPISLQTGGLVVTDQADAEELRRKRTGRAPEPVAFTKTARCNCQMPHDNRPKDVSQGCGAFGTLKVG